MGYASIFDVSIGKRVHLTESDNQTYFDKNKAREKICAVWLKAQAKIAKKWLYLAVSAGVINGWMVIIQSAVLAYLLQAIIIEKLPLIVLMPYLWSLVVIFVVRSLCVYAYPVCGFEAGAKVRSSVRQQLFTQFLKQGPSEIKNHQSGSLATVTLEQVDALEHYFSRYLPQQMLVAILPISILIVVMPFNWIVGVIFLITGPLVILFMALVGMGAASASRNQFLAMSRMSGYFLDRLQGLSTLKLFGLAETELSNINTMANGFREKTMAVLRIAFLSSAILEFFSAIAVALVAVYVGLGLLDQIHFGPAVHISLQEALFVLLLAPEFFMPLRQLAINYHDRAAALGASDAILAILEKEPAGQFTSIDIQKPSSHHLIEFIHVSKKYDQRTVLTDINLSIEPGEKVALVGESGAGKTTLINLLLGFEQPTTGRVLLKGETLTQTQSAQQIAWVGQSTYIFHGSIKDNIALAEPTASAERIYEAAVAAGVTEFSIHLSEGLETQVGERGYGLSGGQVQRIALARAFLKKAEIIVLDEPTANLDDSNKALLLAVINQLFKQQTLIIATHDPLVIKIMSRHIVVSQGGIS